MNIQKLAALAGTIACASAAQAEDRPGFVWEGSVELGFESVYSSDAPANETDTAYAKGEFLGTYSFGNGVAIFAGLTFEEVEDAAANAGYGLYLDQLGVEFGVGPATVQLGKVHPAFGTTWDEAAGYFGSTLAEDYELTEQIGALADLDLGAAGVLSVGLFYADDTALSQSAGFNRGRNSTALGGAGNTGRLDNASLQWHGTFGDTRVWAGARHLSAGAGDVSDETGGFLAIGHTFGGALDVFAEAAVFDGYGGTADNARFVTLNAAYAIGEVTLSGTVATRDVDSLGKTELLSIGAEYEFGDRYLIGAALARIEDAGVTDHVFGVNFEIALGS